MSALSLFRNICQSVSSFAPKNLSVGSSVVTRTMHHMSTKQYTSNLTNAFSNKIIFGNFLLQPFIPTCNITRGLKMKTVLRRRCRGCQILWKEDRKYIICKVNSKHNLVERKKKPYNTWIVTFASQKPQRDW